MRKDNDNPRRGQDAESVWAELRRTVYTRRRHEPGSPPRACRAAPSSGLQPSPPRAHRTARASGSTPVGLNFPSPERLHSLESRAPLPARGPASERSGLRDSLGCSPESGREGLFHAGCLKSSTCPTSPGAGCWEYNSEQDSRSPLRGSGAHEFLGRQVTQGQEGGPSATWTKCPALWVSLGSLAGSGGGGS